VPRLLSTNDGWVVVLTQYQHVTDGQTNEKENCDHSTVTI